MTAYWSFGLDLGQRRDHSALACLAIQEDRLALLGLESFPLGVEYLTYPDHVGFRLCHVASITPDYRAAITIDAGGPGAAVVELFQRARLDVVLRPLVITGGAVPGPRTVPRRALIANLLHLMRSGRLTIPAGLPAKDAFAEELLDLCASTTHPSRSAAHDDLVMAVALAAWPQKVFCQ
jgi:hypothetical protein